MYILECKHCKKTFESIKKKEYCSDLCYSLGRSNANCSVCRKLIYIKPNKLKKQTNTFCSNECKNSIIGRKLLEESIKASSLKKFGETNYFKTSEFQAKSKESHQKKYGSNFVSTNKYKLKASVTNILKYGCENPMQNPKIKSRALKSYKSRDGNYERLTRSLLKKHIEVLSTNDEFINESIYKYKCLKCNNNFESAYSNIQHVFCGSNICQTKSNAEHEIINFLKELGVPNIVSNYNFVFNNKRSQIDCYLPDLKIGIEYDGLYFHSEKFRDKNYHQEKQLLCKDAGIKLLQVYEDEWRDKTDIVKSIIKSAINNQYNIIYGRNTTIKVINDSQYRAFLDENHIQGYCSAKLLYGCFHKNILISVMSFSDRGAMYECIRYCVLPETRVIGAIKKFIAYHYEHVPYKDIYSYVNLRYFNGDGFIKSGFKLYSITKPGYFYTNKARRASRIQTQKHKLIKQGYDASLTEHEIMANLGYYKVYDSGNLKLIFSIAPF